MKIAITGTSGFLGRYVVQILTEAGHQCRGLSRQVAAKASLEMVTGSLADRAAVRSLVAGVDAVVHAAYESQGSGFQDPKADVQSLVESNLLGTIRLIEEARAANVSRFVVVSSGAVHDEILPDRALDEAHPLWPKTHYGATKAAIEAFVSSYGRGDGFAICAIRPTSIYGIADPITASRWYRLVADIVAGKDVTCHQGGKQVHAIDVARSISLLLDTQNTAGEVYQCTDMFVTAWEVAEIARSITEKHSKISGIKPSNQNPIYCDKLKQLGMAFGGRKLLTQTIEQIFHQIQGTSSAGGSS